MNATNTPLFDNITAGTDLDEVLHAAAHLDTADLLALMEARGARTGLEFVLWDRLSAMHDAMAVA